MYFLEYEWFKFSTILTVHDMEKHKSGSEDQIFVSELACALHTTRNPQDNAFREMQLEP